MDGSQVAQVAANAGLSGQALQYAVAIANAESGFNENAAKIDSVETSIGLWQINLDAHPQYTIEQMKDPQQNAAAMFQISGGGTNWNPWSVYTNGSYLAFMGDAAEYAGRAGSGVSAEDQSTAQKVASVVGFAQAQIGKPYEYGGSGPDTWDCSGLTQAAYATIGVDLPHDAAVQAEMGQAIDQAKAAAGDFAAHFGDGVPNGHCGILISHDEWIVAPYTGQNVQVNPVPWDKITAVRRFITGGNPSFWSKVVGTSALDLVGLGDYDIDNPLNALKVLTRAAAWVGKPQNIIRILQVAGGLAACVVGAQMTAKVMSGASVADAAKASTGIARISEAKSMAKSAATKGLVK